MTSDSIQCESPLGDLPLSTPSAPTFNDFGFNEAITTRLNELEFIEPTPIQLAAIPVALANRDMIGLAQTGTGKTAAFVLPILQRLSEGPRVRGHRVLIVAPTRELVDQIASVINEFAKSLNIRCVTVFGGASMQVQIERLRKGPEIIVACPGRLLDHLQRRTVKLNQIDTLVLDEADQMFDMGFLPAIKRLIAAIPQQRHTMLFSATMPSEISGLAEQILTNPETIDIGKSMPKSTIEHAMYPVNQDRKTDLLNKILGTEGADTAVVFTRTKARAKRLAEQLERAGHKVAELHGNLSHGKRQSAIRGVRTGEFNVLVATDVAARGIDIPQISKVINYDMPMTVEMYVHRIGRTGRASRSGEAFTFMSREDRSMVREIEKFLKAPVRRCEVEGFAIPMDGPEDRGGGSRPQRNGGRGGFGGRSSGGRPSGGRSFGGRSSDDRPSRGRSFDSRGPRPEKAPYRNREDGAPRSEQPYRNREDGAPRSEQQPTASFDSAQERQPRTFASEIGKTGEVRRPRSGQSSWNKGSSFGGSNRGDSRGRTFGGDRDQRSRGPNNEDRPARKYGENRSESFGGERERRPRMAFTEDQGSFKPRESSGESFGGNREQRPRAFNPDSRGERPRSGPPSGDRSDFRGRSSGGRPSGGRPSGGRSSGGYGGRPSGGRSSGGYGGRSSNRTSAPRASSRD